MKRWHAELAWTSDGPASDVLLEVSDGVFEAVTAGVTRPPPDATSLRGITLPGLANAHSHAFHRALRGRAQAGRGTFWTWRDRMYAVSERLTPDNYLALAQGVYAEMALAGITCVGEFHYVHHPPGGGVYDDPNAMGHALIEAADRAGIRLTLLDTVYLSGGIDQPLQEPQRRFSDGDAERWAQRAAAIKCGPRSRPGAAVHSVRAVPPDQIATVVAWSHHTVAPIHAHVSEQPAENEASIAAYGLTPTELLHSTGVLGPRTTAVHATHLSERDVTLLAESGTTICMCPTTERDLADGIGPARELAAAGAPVSLGSDSHAVVDLFEEARAMELDERLRSRERGHWPADELLIAATAAGYACLGWPDGGILTPGALADFITVRTDSVRMAGFRPDLVAESLVFAATAADVCHVVVGGREVVRDGRHVLIEDVTGSLHRAILDVTS